MADTEKKTEQNEMTPEQSEKEDISFEEAMAKLENIVRSLESGNAPLDRSLEMFEEGVRLVRLCNGKLDAAEQKMKILVSRGGEEALEEFRPE